jgi:leucyl aminopeptidase
MEESIKQVAEDILPKDRKPLIRIILLLGTVIFLLGSALYSIKSVIDTKEKESLRKDVNSLTNSVNSIEETVVEGFRNQSMELETVKKENETQHKAINKKIDILKTNQDKTRRDQMDLIDEVINMRSTSSVPKQLETPIEELEGKYDKSYNLKNEIYKEIQSKKNTVKKNIDNPNI